MNEPKSKNLNTTRSIAILIHLKSQGIVSNTFADFNFNPARLQNPTSKDERFKVAYLNGVKDSIEIEAPIIKERLDNANLRLTVNNREVILNNIQLEFKGIKDFKELRIIERARVAGKTNNFRELLEEFLLTEWLSFKAAANRQRIIDEAIKPYKELNAKLTEQINYLNGQLAIANKEHSELINTLQRSYDEANSLQAASVVQAQQIDGLARELEDSTNPVVRSLQEATTSAVFPNLPHLIDNAILEGEKTLSLNITVRADRLSNTMPVSWSVDLSSLMPTDDKMDERLNMSRHYDIHIEHTSHDSEEKNNT